MKNSIIGWKSVFWFAFVQDTKNKVLRISTLVLCLIALAVCPVVLLFNGGEERKEDTTSLHNVYVVDYTGLNLFPDLSVLNSEQYYTADEAKLYTNLDFVDRTAMVQQAMQKQQAESPEDIDWSKVYTFREETDAGVYMELQFTGESIAIRYIYDEITKVEDEDVLAFSNFVISHFSDVLMHNQSISDENRVILEASCEVISEADLNDLDAGTDGDEEDSEEISEDEETESFSFEYVISFVVVMMLSVAGGRISVAILTEKSSKIMEYLLTSIRPMAIVVGKVLASLLTLCVQGLCIVVSLGVSVLIAGILNGKGSFVLPEFVKEILASEILKHMEPLECILAVLIIMFGFFFYGLLAALGGAAVSRMEDVSESVKLYSFVMIVGAYLGMFTGMAGDGANEIVLYLACLLPISSMFITPGKLLSSNISLLYGGLALLILAVSLVIFVKFVSSVYESMVYYNGSPLKVRDIIRISQDVQKQKKVTKAEEGGEE